MLKPGIFRSSRQPCSTSDRWYLQPRSGCSCVRGLRGWLWSTPERCCCCLRWRWSSWKFRRRGRHAWLCRRGRCKGWGRLGGRMWGYREKWYWILGSVLMKVRSSSIEEQIESWTFLKYRKNGIWLAISSYFLSRLSGSFFCLESTKLCKSKNINSSVFCLGF